ncbi:O-antigen ligase family protein [Rufibacter quisquiliarum]|uniref:O-antigen ligase n=1 Tax=Rufibacter quisquiliarum TaxID=1549639 RepID=A0A839GE12_9BACT|nr:O-antigen ligase family protein [Rufibacter quisquiliarum]MBA9077844.1 O-antigen ligase [Rufibacter quisquiliarum]
MGFSKASLTKIRTGESLFAFLVYLYAFCLPLRTNLKSILLFVLLGFFLWHTVKTRPALSSILREKTFLALLALFCLTLLSVLYSSNVKAALNFVHLLATLPLLAVMFYRKLTREQVQNALFAFSFGCFLLSVYAITIIFLEYFGKFPEHLTRAGLIDWTYFSYFLPQRIDFHAPYYSLYISTSLLIHCYFLYQKKKSGDLKSMGGHLLFCLFFFALLALLSSRTSLVVTMLVLALVMVYRAAQARRFGMLVVILLGTLVTGITLVQKVTYLRIKFTENAGVDQRRQMWQGALEVIKENPLLGVGAGDREEALVKRYKENGFTEGVNFRFDAHNQYLMFGVEIGVIGVALFLLFLLFTLWKAYRQQNFLLFCFVLIFALCCLTESLLQRRDGSLLFSFLISLLLFAPRRSNQHASVAKPSEV